MIYYIMYVHNVFLVLNILQIPVHMRRDHPFCTTNESFPSLEDLKNT